MCVDLQISLHFRQILSHNPWLKSGLIFVSLGLMFYILNICDSTVVLLFSTLKHSGLLFFSLFYFF